jgi:hypothetical protein
MDMIWHTAEGMNKTVELRRCFLKQEIEAAIIRMIKKTG